MLSYFENRRRILEEIKEDVEKLYQDYGVDVHMDYVDLDSMSRPGRTQVSVDVIQYEGEDGSGGIVTNYANTVRFHIVVPKKDSKAKLWGNSNISKMGKAESLWEYYLTESQFRTFDILNVNTMLLIHRYPQQSDVYSFEMNIITNNK